MAAANIPDLTEPERIFIARMLPHFVRGLSIEESARAVLADDERIFCALADRGNYSHFPTPDERGGAHYSGERPGDVITREMSRFVYRRIRVTR